MARSAGYLLGEPRVLVGEGRVALAIAPKADFGRTYCDDCSSQTS